MGTGAEEVESWFSQGWGFAQGFQQSQGRAGKLKANFRSNCSVTLWNLGCVMGEVRLAGEGETVGQHRGSQWGEVPWEPRC